MQPDAKSPAAFFALVAVLSSPFWLIGRLTSWQPLPGIPASALMFICPCVAAITLVAMQSGRPGVTRWLTQALILRGGARFYFLALLAPPFAMLLSYVAIRVFKFPVPTIEMEYGRAPLVLLAFSVTGLLEQLGWSAYAVDGLQKRRSALSASLIVGAVWALWHVIPLQQANRAPEWIVWWCVMTIALRVLQTSLYNGADRCVLPAALCQASANTAWQYFPNYGSHYDPRVTGLVFLGVAIVLVVRYGSQNLTTNR